MTSDHFNK